MGEQHKPQIHNDQEIFYAFQNGNWEALTRIYHDYREIFIFWANKWCDIEESELMGIYQNALSIFYEKVHFGKLKKLESSIKTYIFAVCRRLIKRYFHKNVRIQNYEEINDSLVKDWELKVADKMDQDHNEHIIQTALKQLEDRQRQVLILFYYHNYTIESIRLKLGYSSDEVVRITKMRALKKLKKIIGS